MTPLYLRHALAGVCCFYLTTLCVTTHAADEHLFDAPASNIPTGTPAKPATPPQKAVVKPVTPADKTPPKTPAKAADADKKGKEAGKKTAGADKKAVANDKKPADTAKPDAKSNDKPSSGADTSKAADAPAAATPDDRPPPPLKDLPLREETRRNRALAEEIDKQQGRAGKGLWVGEGKEPWLAVLSPQEGRKIKGSVILMHDLAQHPDWPGILHALRIRLPKTGWLTLSISVPDYIPPADETTPSDNGDVTQRQVEIPADHYADEVRKRIDDAIAKVEGDDENRTIAIVAFGQTAGMVAGLLAHHPDKRIAELVMIKPQPFASQAQTLADDIAGLTIPVLDVVGDEPEDGAPELRKQTASRAEGSRYNQRRMLAADIDFGGYEEAVGKTVSGWLTKHRKAPPPPPEPVRPVIREAPVVAPAPVTTPPAAIITPAPNGPVPPVPAMPMMPSGVPNLNEAVPPPIPPGFPAGMLPAGGTVQPVRPVTVPATPPTTATPAPATGASLPAAAVVPVPGTPAQITAPAQGMPAAPPGAPVTPTPVNAPQTGTAPATR